MQRLAVELQQKKGIAGKDGGATQKNLQLYLMATFSSRNSLFWFDYDGLLVTATSLFFYCPDVCFKILSAAVKVVSSFARSTKIRKQL